MKPNRSIKRRLGPKRARLAGIALVLCELLGCNPKTTVSTEKTSPAPKTEETSPAPQTEPVKKIEQVKTIDATEYRYVEVDPKRIEMRWRDDRPVIGGPYGTFRAVYDSYPEDKKPAVIMNAGIYEPDYTPTGLYVEDGEELVPINRNKGKGNFFLKPNGVFYIKDGKAGIEKTSKYKIKNPSWATQSGPMLLYDGKIDKKFSVDHVSKKIRNGVCVKPDGNVVLLISQKNPENMNHFANAMKSLGCHRGLYLDGTVSRMYTEGESLFRHSRAYRYAGFIVVRE